MADVKITVVENLLAEDFGKVTIAELINIVHALNFLPNRSNFTGAITLNTIVSKKNVGGVRDYTASIGITEDMYSSLLADIDSTVLPSPIPGYPTVLLGTVLILYGDGILREGVYSPISSYPEHEDVSLFTFLLSLESIFQTYGLTQRDYLDVEDLSKFRYKLNPVGVELYHLRRASGGSSSKVGKSRIFK